MVPTMESPAVGATPPPSARRRYVLLIMPHASMVLILSFQPRFAPSWSQSTHGRESTRYVVCLTLHISCRHVMFLAGIQRGHDLHHHLQPELDGADQHLELLGLHQHPPRRKRPGQ